jgi:predicted HTH domain antitoxin
MTTIPISVNEDFAALLRVGERSLSATAVELMVLELYRRGVVSGGKAAEWLGTSRQDFIQHASRLGIPAIQMMDEDWEAESKLAASL